MTYVDGFLLVVKKKNIKAYTKMAHQGGKIWKKHGALRYLECIGDDLQPKFIKLTFPKLVKLKPNETVWYSFIVYKNKAHRNKVNAQVMKDPKMNDFKEPMPFDFNKMSCAGFKAIVDLQ